MGEDPLNDGRVLNRGDELHPPGTEEEDHEQAPGQPPEGRPDRRHADLSHQVADDHDAREEEERPQEPDQLHRARSGAGGWSRTRSLVYRGSVGSRGSARV